MPDNDYVSRGSEAFEDDSSAALALTHDPKGRPIVTLPTPEAPAYEPAMVGLSPDGIIEYLKRKQEARDSNNVAQLMREIPGGGQLSGSRSSGGGNRRRRKPSRAFRTARLNDIAADDAPAMRPNCVSARVSYEANAALRMQSVSTGEIINVLGETLHAGVSWARIEWTLCNLVDQKALQT